MVSKPVRFKSSRPNGDVELEGRLHLPQEMPLRGGSVLCHPHPAGGGEMGVHLMVQIAEALCSRGHAVLRFNFAGVGQSDGQFTDGAEEPYDVLSAAAYLEALQDLAAGSVNLAGWSFGSWMALHALALGLETPGLVSVAPPLAVYPFEELPALLLDSRAKRYYLAGDRDTFCPVDTLLSFAAAISPSDAMNVMVLEGADHFFFGREQEVADMVAEKICS